MEKINFAFFLMVGLVVCDDYVHNPIQYQSLNNRGGYNFGYDTGLSGSHQFHQESKDDFGVVRGRYGYTDPNGKLRLVYYSSDAVNGYKAWGPDIPESTNNQPKSLKVQESKTSSRIIYPQSPASKVSAIKSSKVIIQPYPLPPPSKIVQREQVIHKTHYSPADTFRSRYTSSSSSSSSSSVVSKTSSIKRSEIKGSPIIVQQQFQSPVAAIKSQSIKSANRPVPITPAQYRSNYPPSGKYSRCYCE
ncbi:uncharacterized protein LOC128393815 [Panonychus citri]|uniref:uncharacterized protein LOC128393815 n=1 Tax=Panonychus citri TaxID=50023 RepID=UPI002307F02E|nr:uncharacterized protein LOC128393815 [Panonychus citri]XP_053210008.1 uncharacterized protein LOC128393815 [Panonychus citri]